MKSKNLIVSTTVPRNILLERITMLCGIFSSVLYIVTDLIASSWYEGYNIFNQNYSELLATGAPTRSAMLMESILYNLLIAILAVGVWLWVTPKRTAHFTGATIMLYAILSMITPSFFQMDMRGAEITPRGSLHGPMTAIMSLFIFLSMTFGAFLPGKRFRMYSFITIIILVIFGVLTSLQAPRLVAGQPPPWMGLTERINIYATMLWFALFSFALLRKTTTH